jgi:hypothetical protein
LTQKKRNIRLLISLIVLVCATAVLFWFKSQDDQKEVDPSLFKVDDLRSIGRVVLQSDSGSVQLSFTNSRWMVNEKYPADNRMIQVLFATLQQAEPKRPVASSVDDSLSHMLDQFGTKVSLYSGQELVKSFTAGGNAGKTQSYFKNDDGRVYIVTIPGYKVYVSGIFELDESGFRDKYVFAFNWRNFKSLKAEFSEKPAENFQISLGKEFFTIEGMTNADTSKINTYLDDVSFLMAERFLPGDSAASSGKESPYMIISIADLADRKYELTLFKPQAKNSVKGLINREPALFSINDIRRIIKPRSFFIKR